jgi:phosphorylcholine metabolism protein LicD
MSQRDKKDIDAFLETISKTFDKHDIKYWIMSGTLLGSVRHGDIVPWDDDADIGVFESDINKILDLTEYYNDLGYEVIRRWKIYRFKKIGQEYPFVDIFPFVKKENKYVMNRKDLIEIWPNEYYFENELFPLKKYKFGNEYLWGPNFPLEHLDRIYPNWRFVGKQTFDHRTNRNINMNVDLNHSNPEHKLKPYLYLDTSEDIKKVYDEHYNEKIIVVKN